jgi:peroxiredoxin
MLILAVSAVWIFLTAAQPGSVSTQGIPAPQEGFFAPDFTLPKLDGESLALSDFRGQPVLINLWASWCGPCRAEMPAMERVYQEYQREGFMVLAVNATNQDSEEDARFFAQQYGLTFPILLDVTGEVSQIYRLRALPTSFFVDPEGIIREVVIGGPMSEALLRTRVERLLSD